MAQRLCRLVVKVGVFMYSALDVASYIIKYSNEKDYGVSNLKLQKLLYFVQAYFLIVLNIPCFYEKIEAWDFGPVVPEVYQSYKQFGGANIPCFENVCHDIVGDVSLIKQKDKKKIEKVVDKFKDYSATDLVRLTHGQAPWREAYEPWANNVITNESIKEYFDGK